jgi:hypothetical protein
MSEIDAVLYEYVKSIHVIYTDFFCFQASTALCIFMSTYANSWIKVAARQNTIWIRFGNRRAVRRWRAEAGMALAAIGEFTQWGGVADCSGSRTVEAVDESGLRLHQTATTDAREDWFIGGLMVAQPDSALRRQNWIQQLNGFGRPERVGDSAEEDRAAPLRPGVCSGPLQSHESYGGVGRRRVVP